MVAFILCATSYYIKNRESRSINDYIFITKVTYSRAVELLFYKYIPFKLLLLLRKYVIDERYYWVK